MATTIKATLIPSPSPIATPTAVPVVETPVPQSSTNWIMTHKKIDLGVVIAIVVIVYVIYLFTKKNKNTPPEGPRPEEPAKPEEQTPSEGQTNKEE